MIFCRDKGRRMGRDGNELVQGATLNFRLAGTRASDELQIAAIMSYSVVLLGSKQHYCPQSEARMIAQLADSGALRHRPSLFGHLIGAASGGNGPVRPNAEVDDSCQV
jgi:hypothetical protein